MKKKLRVAHIAYVVNNKETDPQAWLKQLGFYTVVLKKMADHAEVFNFDFIGYTGVVHQNNISHYFKRTTWVQLLFPIGTHNRMKGLKLDAVIVHGLITPWQVILLRWQLGDNIKIVLQHHAERPFRDIRKYLQRWADRYVNAYLFSSREHGMHWIQNNQIQDAQKIKLIMGTSSTFYPVEKQLARAKTGVVGEVVFLWVGRLNSNKDPMTVIRAFDQLASLNQHVHLYWIYQTNELESELKRFIESSERSSKHQIHFVGKMDYEQLLWWYNSADFIVSGSHYEGSGISACEAMSCGCVPILTRIPSFEWMTDKGRIGLLYNIGDLNGLYRALQQSLRLDFSVEQQKVLSWYESQLSPTAAAREINNLIHSLYE